MKAMAMRKWTVFLALFTMIAFSPAADAALVETVIQTRNDGSILMWLNDANYAGEEKNWDDAIAWIETLNTASFLGYQDWRLPKAEPISGDTYIVNKDPSTDGTADYGYNITSPKNDLAYLYNVEVVTAASPHPFESLSADFYWSGSEFDLNEAWAFDFGTGLNTSLSKEEAHYAWAARDIVPVPNPGGFFLLGSGLLGLVGIRMRNDVQKYLYQANTRIENSCGEFCPAFLESSH